MEQTRQEAIASKRKAIQGIEEQQFALLKQAVAIHKRPAKRFNTQMKRVGKSIALMLQMRALEAQKQLIAWQPIAPDFEKGGVLNGTSPPDTQAQS